MGTNEEPELLGTTIAPSIGIELQKLGTPGAQVSIHVVPLFADRRPPPEAVIADRTSRQFVVTGKLAKEPSSVGANGKIDASFGQDDGDSYLVAPASAVAMQFETPLGVFLAKPTKSGALGIIDFECTASTPNEARHKFIEGANVWLDHLAYASNVAVFITTMRVLDVTHQSTHITFTAPYRNRHVGNSSKALFAEMKPVYAMYREAKNATSEFYKFLCLYKILEGLFGKLRGDVCVRITSKGGSIHKNRDVVPHDPDFPEDLRRYVGKSMKAFFDNVLTARFRDAVAHFKTGNEALDVSSPTERDRYGGSAFVADLCARKLIDSHEQLLLQLKDMGG